MNEAYPYHRVKYSTVHYERGVRQPTLFENRVHSRQAALAGRRALVNHDFLESVVRRRIDGSVLVVYLVDWSAPAGIY